MGTKEAAALELSDALSQYKVTDSLTLEEASRQKPLLIIFLRHFGCLFCRQALSDLSDSVDAIRADGVELVLVHMSTEEEAREFFGGYGLQDTYAVSDPSSALYRAFRLTNATFKQIFGVGAIIGGLKTMGRGHFQTTVKGNAFQMPGVFLVQDGRIIKEYRHENAASRPDYREIAACPIE